MRLSRKKKGKKKQRQIRQTYGTFKDLQNSILYRKLQAPQRQPGQTIFQSCIEGCKSTHRNLNKHLLVVSCLLRQARLRWRRPYCSGEIISRGQAFRPVIKWQLLSIWPTRCQILQMRLEIRSHATRLLILATKHSNFQRRILWGDKLFFQTFQQSI